jgi:hypothetical protein
MNRLQPLSNPLVFAERVLGVGPHSGQAAFLLDRHPVRVLIGGRRAGKSLGLAVDLAWNLVRARAEGRAFRSLITAPVLDQARLLLGHVVRLLRASPVGGLITHERESPFPELSLGDDVVLLLRSAGDDGKHLRGHGALHAVVVDEAGFMPDATVQEAITPLLADSGGRLVLASTPTVRGGLLHRLFERGMNDGDPRVKSFHFRSLDNPHLDHDFVRAQRSEITAEQWAVEYEGKFTDANESVFRWHDVAACTTESADVLPSTTVVIGFDPAKARDGSAVVAVTCSKIPRQVVHLDDLSGRDYTAQVAEVARLARQFGRTKVMIDATGGGAVLVDMLRAAKVWVEPIIFTANQKAELVMSLALALEKREVLFPPDRRLLDELRWFRASRTATGHVRYEAPAGGRDDFVCALALALLGAGAGRPRSFAEDGMLPIVTSNGRSPLNLCGRVAGRDYFIARDGEIDQTSWGDLVGASRRVS